MNTMNRLKRFVAVFVTATVLGLAVPASHAKLGDTEFQVILANYGAKVTRDTINDRAKVIVFTYKDREYAVGVLDGKVESEIFSRLDDAKPSKEFVLKTIHAYRWEWYPISCDDDNCAAAMSDDGWYFAKVGPSRQLRKQWAFWVFSETWRQFAVEYSKPKAILQL